MDLARQIHVLVSIQLAARGHVLILILTLTTAVLVRLCRVVEHSLAVALGSVQTYRPVCSIVDPVPLHHVRACCRLAVVGRVLIWRLTRSIVDRVAQLYVLTPHQPHLIGYFLWHLILDGHTNWYSI